MRRKKPSKCFRFGLGGQYFPGGIPPFCFAVCFSIGAVAFSRSFAFPAPSKAARRTYFEFEYSAMPLSDSCPNIKKICPKRFEICVLDRSFGLRNFRSRNGRFRCSPDAPTVVLLGEHRSKSDSSRCFPVSSGQGQPPRRNPASVRRRRPSGLGAVRETDRKPRRRFRSSAPPRHPTEAVLF